MVLAGLLASPLSVSAQGGEEGATSQPNLEEPAPSSEPAPEEPTPSSEPAPEEPALELKLDEAGLELAPSPPRTAEGYTLEEMELRVKGARTGLIVSSVIVGVGVALWAGGAVHDARNPPPDAFDLEIPNGLIIAGLTLTMVGSIGMVVSVAMLGVRKRKLRKQELGFAVDDYTPEKMELRVKRAKIGLYVSGGVLFVGTVMMVAGFAGNYSPAIAWTGAALMTGGFFATVAAGSMLRARKRKLHELNEAHYRKPRRVQWDLARSALVF
jgi:hypothetical protein